MQNKFEITDDEVWYIIVNNQTRGPSSLRDLDVLLRTNQINSQTYGWKNGMKEWKVLHEIEEIKESILESSKEIIEIEKKRESLFDKKKEEEVKPQEGADDTIQNKDEDVLAILELTVENMLKKSFHQSEDGKWNVYDEEVGEWTKQDEEPIANIQKMKTQLFNKLKNELFFEDKIHKRKKPQHVEESKQPQEPLTEEQMLKRERNKKKTKRAAEKKKEKWYNAKINTFIYISGLPFDITEEELKQFASKAGVLRIDLNSGKEKIKIYKDETGFPKGDAAVSYLREESVDIAIENLNGSEIRSGFSVKIEKAQFNQKQEDYKPRELKKAGLVKKILAKKNETKKLTWAEDVDEQGEGLKIVIMKHVFEVGSLANESEIEQVKKQIAEELHNIGQVQRVRFYETHPDGVVEVKFRKEKDAETCVHLMNGRFFDAREILCDYWDGETDYKRDHTSLLVQQQRLNSFVQDDLPNISEHPSEENLQDAGLPSKKVHTEGEFADSTPTGIRKQE